MVTAYVPLLTREHSCLGVFREKPDKTTGVRDISMDEAQQRLWHASDTLNDDHRRRRVKTPRGPRRA